MRHLIIWSCTYLFLSACSSDEETRKLRAKLESIQEQNNSLKLEINEREEFEKKNMKELLDITRWQSEVSNALLKSKLRLNQGVEFNSSKIDPEDDLKTIKELVNQGLNYQELIQMKDSLSKKNSAYELQLQQTKMMISYMVRELDEVKTTMMANEAIYKKNKRHDDSTIAEQSQQIVVRDRQIKVKDSIYTKEAQTVYYLKASFERLINSGYIKKYEEGGFLGIGKAVKYEITNQTQGFMEVDKYKLDKLDLPVPKKNVKVVSNHPSNSYKLNDNEGKQCVLKITDKDSFWLHTRYLVVGYKE